MAVETEQLHAATAFTASGATPDEARPPRSLRRVLQLIDVIGFAAGWTIAWVPRATRGSISWSTMYVELAVIVVSSIVFASAHGLYRTRINTMRVVAYSRLMSASAVAAAVAFAVTARFDGTAGIKRPVLGAVLAFAFTAVGRYSFDFWLIRARSARRYLRRIVLVADEHEGRRFHDFLESNPEIGYDVTAIVGPTSDPDLGIPWLGSTTAARVAVSSTGSSGAIVLCNGLPTQQVNEVTRELNAAGVHVHLSSGLFGVNYRRLRAVPLGHEPFLYLEPATLSAWQLMVKRVVDVTFAVLALVLTTPVLIVSAIAIKLHDRGPILFTQTRVGRNGKPIRVHKLRTMSVDAEARLEEVMHLNERSGPLFKTESDPRVTRVGAFLRATSIDEIPQLFDVLRGDMSLVGPRPALPEEVAEFDDALLGRLRVRPGVTGLWQVEAREKPSFDAYRRLDLFYVENWTLTLDLAIVIDTLPAVADRALRSVAGSLRRRRQDAPVLTAVPAIATADIAVEGDPADTAT